MSKKIEEIKEQVANDNGWQTWDNATPPWVEPKEVERLMNEVAERYAKSQTQELQEQNAELVEMLKQTVRALDGNGFPRLRSQIEELLAKYNHLNKKP